MGETRTRIRNKEKSRAAQEKKNIMEQQRMGIPIRRRLARSGDAGASTAKPQQIFFYFYASFRQCTPAFRRTSFTFYLAARLLWPHSKPGGEPGQDLRSYTGQKVVATPPRFMQLRARRWRHVQISRDTGESRDTNRQQWERRQCAGHRTRYFRPYSLFFSIPFHLLLINQLISHRQ